MNELACYFAENVGRTAGLLEVVAVENEDADVVLEDIFALLYGCLPFSY